MKVQVTLVKSPVSSKPNHIKIVKALGLNKIRATKVFEDNFCYAFRDINPQAPTHILMVPKTHITSVAEVSAINDALVGHMFAKIAEIARQEGLEENGYRVVSNVGEHGGQTVPHLHFHLLGGKPLSGNMG